MSSPAQKAEELRRLHHQPRPLLLPNAWDVPSARTFEEIGFPAVATSSAALMVAHGYPDGQEMPRRDLVRVTGTIAGALSVPLSADVVSGYGRGPRDVGATVRSVLAAGAVGINLEDRDPRADRLLPVASQVRKIETVRRLGESIGVRIVINARTDAFHVGPGGPEERFREAIRRGIAYRDAGADCVYPMGLTEAVQIGTYVRTLECPVNVMVRPGLPPLAELESLGVKRVSFGPSASYAVLGFLRRIGEEVLRKGSFNLLIEGAISYTELNALAVPRSSSKATSGADPVGPAAIAPSHPGADPSPVP